MRFSPDPAAVALVLLTFAWMGFVYVLGGRGGQWLHRAIDSGAKVFLGLWLVPWGIDLAGRGDLFGPVAVVLGALFLVGAAMDVPDARRERRSRSASDASKVEEQK